MPHRTTQNVRTWYDTILTVAKHHTKRLLGSLNDILIFFTMLSLMC